MKILIIEDHALFRDFLVGICKENQSVESVYSVGDGESGIAAIHQEKPDITLLDLDLPDMDGFALLDQVIGSFPSMRMVAVSSYCDEFTLYRVLKNGLFGYIDKTSQSIDDLRHALKEVIAWRPYYCAGVHQYNLLKRADPDAFQKILTNREQEFLCYFGVGLSNEEIAVRFGIAETTVQTHRRNIMQKLNIGSRSELIQFALTRGFSRVSEIVRMSGKASAGVNQRNDAAR